LATIGSGILPDRAPLFLLFRFAKAKRNKTAGLAGSTAGQEFLPTLSADRQASGRSPCPED